MQGSANLSLGLPCVVLLNLMLLYLRELTNNEQFSDWQVLSFYSYFRISVEVKII